MTREELNKEMQEEIENAEHKEKRKKVVILILKVFFSILLIFTTFYLYTTYLSTTNLIVKEKRIISKELPSHFNGIKVIQFSDLHYGTTVHMEQLKKLVREINKRKPDIVLYTGDLIDSDYKIQSKETEKIMEELKKIDATLGKYAVKGDEDKENYDVIMKQSDFTLMNNQYDLIYLNHPTPILLVGIGSLLKEQAKVEDAFSYFQEPTHLSSIYTICMFHEGDTMVDLQNRSCHLSLAGHSFNGTIRIPKVTGIIPVDGARKYHEPYYNINGNPFYISNGIGTKSPSFRLFNRPSFYFFRISNS